ncbi:uncharacterized protein yc1106_01974 [Curvularia clavata]|uniref:Carrier domain-containing protein n=1 Tax=Curvularia clavata TaxID=95742 RepID=A0A9Q8Z2X7_CURCL|nr:uncharacterized protein yc1106_01974 [Curvularia clavata]
MGSYPEDGNRTITREEEDTIWSWNACLPPASNLTITQLFSKQADESPDAPAVDAPDGIITYGQLDAYSTRLALHLRAMVGDTTGDETVPICFDRSIWLVICMMAVSKAGMGFATFDPSHPTERLHTCLAAINPRAFLVEEKFRDRFSNTDLNVVSNVPEICSVRDGKTDTATDLPAGLPSDLSYVCFTSGSTGEPKVLQHTQSSAVATAADDKAYSVGACILNAASPAFPASIVLTLKTICNGGLLVLPPERERMGGLANFITKKGITNMFLTPTQLNLLKPEDVGCLKLLLVGGEPLTQKLIDIWAPHLTLAEAYGMSEGVGIVNEIDKSGIKSRSLQAIRGCAWIVDPDDINTLMPIGETGELVFEGHVLFKGYRNNPETNAKSIIEGPPSWAKKRGEERPKRLFRTGDLAKYIEDGVVQIVGRKDTRVKLHGQRFELGEVEKSMVGFLPTGVTVAAGIVEPVNGYGPMLVAYIHGLSTDFSQEVKQLREKMAAILPEYMVPRGFVELKDRPLNPSGKLDRLQLRKRAAEMSLVELIRHTSSSEKTLPVTEQEKSMQSLWATVLGLPIDYIGLDDDFFYLGGDSLQAMKLFAAARRENILLDIEDILKHRILRAMSEAARFGSEAESIKVENGHQTYKISGITSDIPEEDVEDVALATDWQAWCIGQGLLQAHGWHDYMILKFSKDFDVERLQHVCQQLLDRHAIFRTVFFVKERKTFQVVLKPKAYPFHFLMKQSGGQNVDEVVKETIREDMRRNRQLGDPLVAFTLVQDSKNATSQLIFRISHAQYDGACMDKLWRFLEALYLDQPLEVIPFKKFCEEASLASKNSEPFWKDVLANSSMTEVRSHTRPSIEYPINNAAKSSIPMIDLKVAGFTQATAVLTSWSIVLSKLTGQTSVVFGYLSSGRDLPMPGVSDVIGACLNVLPLRTDIQLTTQTSSLLSSVQSNYLKALQHGHLGHYHIIENCTAWPRWTRFSTIVNHVSLGSIKPLFSGVGECAFEYYEPEHDKADLWLQTFVRGNELEVELRYSTKAFSHDWVKGVLDYFVGVYKQLPNILPHQLEEKLPPFNLTLPEDDLVSSRQLNGKTKTPSLDHLGNIEANVLSCWESVFGIDVRSDVKFSHDTPFYEIWGSAIAAPALASEYTKNGLDMSCEEVYEYPSITQTIPHLARRMNGVTKGES